MRRRPDPDAGCRCGRRRGRRVPHPRDGAGGRPCPGWTRTGCCPDAACRYGAHRRPADHRCHRDAASAGAHPDAVRYRRHPARDAGSGCCHRPGPRGAAAAAHWTDAAAAERLRRGGAAGSRTDAAAACRVEPERHPAWPAACRAAASPTDAEPESTARERTAPARSPVPKRTPPGQRSAGQMHPAWVRVPWVSQPWLRARLPSSRRSSAR